MEQLRFSGDIDKDMKAIEDHARQEELERVSSKGYKWKHPNLRRASSMKKKKRKQIKISRKINR